MHCSLLLYPGVRLELGPGQVTEELQLSDVNQASENLALSTGRPAFPLPKGKYVSVVLGSTAHSEVSGSFSGLYCGS